MNILAIVYLLLMIKMTYTFHLCSHVDLDDYLARSVMRSFEPNGNAMQCTMVTTLTDQLVESDEFFEVALTSSDSVIPPSQPARVVIRDDDGRVIHMVVHTCTDNTSSFMQMLSLNTVQFALQLTSTHH